MKANRIKGVIFDLDGVLVDTAIFHYKAWRNLAQSLGFDFTESQNEALKGVSRKESLEYLLDLGNVPATEDQKMIWAEEKNQLYLEMISNLDENALLPGSLELIKGLKQEGIRLALGSASKNAMPVLQSTGLINLLDFVADGNSTNKSKPDPDVFLIAAEGLGFSPEECLVVEDSEKGIEAAVKGGFSSLGVGNATILAEAGKVVPSLEGLNAGQVLGWYEFSN